MADPTESGGVAVGDGQLGVLADVGFRLTGRSRLLTREIERFHPHIMHSHHGTDAVVGLGLKERLRIPLIVTFHGFDATRSDESLRNGCQLRPDHLEDTPALHVKQAHDILEYERVRT